jgi:hypothetical protein
LKTILKVFAIVFLFAVAVNADSTKSIKSEQYVALTGGTNGFGAKYSFCVGPLSMDFGLPLLYLFGKIKENDTINLKNKMQMNPYLSANLIFFKRERATVSVGVAWIVAYEYYRDRRLHDTTRVKHNRNDNRDFNYWIGPIFEYNQRGKNNQKLFGMQMLPVKLHLDGTKSYISDIGVQLNFYLRKLEHSPEEDD